MKTYVGIDLHSNNSYFAVMSETGERLFHKRYSNKKTDIMKALDQVNKFGEIKRLAVESTYNWYWLIDFLHELGYQVDLTNPAAVHQYNGLKITDDKSDAYFLAELLRLNILPKCWICPKEDRPLRDLLRTRMHFVQNRTSLKNSLTSLLARQTGQQLSYSKLIALGRDEVNKLVGHEDITYRISQLCSQIYTLDRSIKDIEKRAFEQKKLSPEFQNLNTVPGIGKILALVIMVETGDINRFKKSGKYTSYCRCVGTDRKSNGKSKGSNNKKNGNKYLSWAYAEAAINCKRLNQSANKYWQKKAARAPRILAYKSLAAKLTKACYYIIRDQREFNEKLIFGYEGETGAELLKTAI